MPAPWGSLVVVNAEDENESGRFLHAVEDAVREAAHHCTSVKFRHPLVQVWVFRNTGNRFRYCEGKTFSQPFGGYFIGFDGLRDVVLGCRGKPDFERLLAALLRLAAISF